MARRKKFKDGCSICGKKMYYGDEAYGTTTGDISTYAEGFCMSEEPWLTVACKNCGEKISEAINDLVEKETKKRLDAQFRKQMRRKEGHGGKNP